MRYRDGDLRTALLCWWRELEIHLADARIDYGPQDWPRELCHHLLAYLSPRAPQGLRLVLEATDDALSWEYGADTAPRATVSGRLTDLTAW